MISTLRAGLAGIGLALVVALGAPASPAAAHASLDLVSPSNGERLTESPTELVIDSSEDIEPEDVHVTLSGIESGDEYAIGDVSRVGEGRYRITVEEELGQESHVVQVATVGFDGHPVTEVFGFVIGDGPNTSPTGSTSSTDGVDVTSTIFGAAKALGLASLIVLGMPLALLLFWRPGLAVPFLTWLLPGALALSMVTTAMELMSWSAQLRGASIGGWQIDHLGSALALPAGKLLLLRPFAAAAIVVCVVVIIRLQARGQRSEGTENFAAVGLFLLALTYAAAGHASTDEWAMVTIAAATVHVAGMLTWFGGMLFWLLWLTSTRTRTRTAVDEPTRVSVDTYSDERSLGGEHPVAEPPGAAVSAGVPTRRSMESFSALARWSVAAVLLSGVLLAWRFTDGVGLFTFSFYSALLWAKVALVAAVLLAALRSHRAWTRAELDREVDRTVLKRALALEISLGIVVLTAGALLSSAALPGA